MLKRQMLKRLSSVLFIILLTSGWADTSPVQRQTYIPLDASFANPERGFYIQRAPLYLNGARYPLADEELASYRNQGISLIRVYYVLESYRTQPLDAFFFSLFEEDMRAVRAAGFKVILRFSYNFPGADDYETSQDASLEWVLRHIRQLTPYLRAHADIMAHMEAGFIGAWGEWHSSFNGLIDTPEPGINAATRAIIEALLGALPSTRMIAIRYPLLKQQLFGEAPLSPDQAFTGIAQARIGAHNDCFLASETDWGTYIDAAYEPQIAFYKDYLHDDNRYVVQSGETCNAAEDAQPYIQCENALTDLRRLRWQSLNRDYLDDVLNLWREQGCYDEIDRHLGYRFVMQEVVAPTHLSPGSRFALSLTLTNQGFASPYNPRGFALLLRGRAGDVYQLVLDEIPDPRHWQAGETLTLTLSGPVPATLPAGDYALLLHLPDPETSLSTDPRYAIRVANEGLWEEATGYHDLRLWVTVEF